MVHILDIKTYLKCPKLYKETYGKNELTYNPYLRKDEGLTELVMKKLKVKDAYIGQKDDTNEHSLKMLACHEWLLKARFEYEGLRVKVPFLKKTEDGYWLYFVQMQNYPKEEDLIYYYSLYHVLTKNKIKIKKIRIVHFNANYRRGKALNPSELFEVSAHFYNESHLPQRKVLDVIKHYYYPYKDTMKKMNKTLNMEQVPYKKARKCIKKTRCILYDQCFKDERETEGDSILTLMSSKYKLQMFQEGITLLKDADMNRVEKTHVQLAQIQASKNGGLFKDVQRLSQWLEKLDHRPLTFIDMEWDTFAIPPFEHMRTFEVICFQYSMHILDDQQRVKHCEYLGYQDCRKEFIERLLQEIPKEGAIVAFNADGAEKLRLKELAIQYPEYEEALDKLQDRMVDISKPFLEGMAYDIKMSGRFSLKAIAHMVDPEIDYQEMQITHGMDAVYQWRKMDKNHVTSNEVEKHLLTYCGQDSYALVKIYQWLCEQVKDKN